MLPNFPSLSASLRYCVILLLTTTVSGCFSLKGPAPKQVVGNWVMSGIEGENVSPADRKLIGKSTMTFEADGRIVVDLPNTMERIQGRYRIEKDMLIMTFDGEDAEAEIVTLKKAELAIRPILKDKEVGYTVIYTRK